MALLIFYVLLALGVSFICSILEAVLLSVSPGFIKTEISEGKPYAQKLQSMKRDLDKPISAILTLNTIAHTMGAAGAGAQWKVLYQDTGEAIFAGVLTFLVLVISEIIPKTIGAKFWRTLAAPSTTVLHWIIRLTTACGALAILSLVTRLVGGKKEGQGVSRSELVAMAELSSQDGYLDDEESEILRNLLMLKSSKVQDIMTPRIVVYIQPENTNAETFLNEAIEEPFSRIPVYGSDPDNITGFVLKSEVMAAHIRGEAKDKTLKDFRRPIVAVPSFVSVYQAFKLISEHRVHLMLAVNEFGGMQGVVTMEDVIETLLGMEIIDEADKSEDMQQVARRLWRRRAATMGIKINEEGNVIAQEKE